MAVNLLGLTQGLNDAAQGVQSGYFNALANVRNYGLAQQKQASESGLQAAQADYFSGRNQSAQDVAATRAAAMGSAATIKAGTAQAAQRDKALTALPGDLANLYYQQPETVKAFTDAYDRQNGTSLTSSLFPGMGASTPGSVSPALPPPAAAQAPGVQGLPPMSLSVPGVGLSGMGMSAAPVPPITGGSPALPPPSGSVSGLPAPSNAPAAAVPLIAASGSPTLPPPSGPVGNAPPLVNPLQAPPLVAARANSLNASAGLNQLKAQFYPNLTQSQINDNLGKAGLMTAQGRFYDAKTKEEVPMDQAKIALDHSLAYQAAQNGSTLPAYRQGLIQNGQTVAGAAVTRANADQQNVNQNGAYQQGELNLGAGRLGVSQGELSLNTQKYLSAGVTGGKNGGMTSQQYQQIIDKNNATKNQILTAHDAQGNQIPMTADRQAVLNQADINIRQAQAGQHTLSLQARQPGGYNGPIPQTQADYQRMTAPQRTAWVLHLHQQNAAR